jgi:hypothetical protein
MQCLACDASKGASEGAHARVLESPSIGRRSVGIIGLLVVIILVILLLRLL